MTAVVSEEMLVGCTFDSLCGVEIVHVSRMLGHNPLNRAMS